MISVDTRPVIASQGTKIAELAKEFVLDLSNACTDPDTATLGDVVILTAKMKDNSSFPSWLTFSDQKVFKGTPVANETVEISLSCKDKHLAEATSTFTIKAEGNAPPLYTRKINDKVFANGETLNIAGNHPF